MAFKRCVWGVFPPYHVASATGSAPCRIRVQVFGFGDTGFGISMVDLVGVDPFGGIIPDHMAPNHASAKNSKLGHSVCA